MNIAIFIYLYILNIDKYLLNCNLQFWNTLVPPHK